MAWGGLMAVADEIDYVSLDELLLDPKNPRLGRRNLERDLQQQDILEIIRSWEPEELAVSFIESGFWPQEALVVVQDPEVDTSKLVVVEGNRRLAALRLLRAASEGEPRTRRWKELAGALSDTELFERIPVLRADRREDVRKFLGFRHVTGIKEWAPAEKAQYIAALIDSGMTYVEVMRAIGSKTPTVRRNYISFNMLKQIEDLEEVDIDPVEQRFSVLFLSLKESGIQKFLGVDMDAEPEAAKKPVGGEEYIANLEYFVKWVFGTKEVPPLFSDSRLVTKFSRILESAEAVEYLKTSRNPSLAAAASRAGAETEELVELLLSATDELEQALSTVHHYVAKPTVKEAVDRLTKSFRALLRSFPEHRRLLCDSEED
jgi:hypothetical protein